MKRVRIGAVAALVAAAGVAGLMIGGRAAVAAPAKWVWFDEGDPLSEAPAETRYFRHVPRISRPHTVLLSNTEYFERSTPHLF